MRFVVGALQEMAESSNTLLATPFGMKIALSEQRIAMIICHLTERRPLSAADCNKATFGRERSLWETRVDRETTQSDQRVLSIGG